MAGPLIKPPTRPLTKPLKRRSPLPPGARQLAPLLLDRLGQNLSIRLICHDCSATTDLPRLICQDRAICKARQPACPTCPLADLCPSHPGS